MIKKLIQRKEESGIDEKQGGSKKMRKNKMKKGLSLVIVLLLAGIVSSVFLPGCAEKQETIKIVTSFIMREMSVGKEIVDGINLALEEVDYKVGGFDIELVVEDDGNEYGVWEEDREREIANRAVADPDVMIYLGTLNSGAAKISIPITNEAGLAQISPGNTWPGLTKSGFIPGEPGMFYPTGVRNYFRVVTTDDIQGPVGAKWARDLGAKNVYIFDDGDAYGKGIADIFEQKSLELGLNVVGHKSIDRTAFDFTDDVNELKGKDVDLIYFGGVTANGALYLIQNIRTLLGSEIKFMGPDGIMTKTFIEEGGVATEGVYVTTIGLPSSELKETRFYKDYVAEYGREPMVWAAFGYEAMRVSLLAIERAGVKDRTAILNEMANTEDYEGIFGTWSFDENGDTTLKVMSANIVINGEFVFQGLLER